MGENVYFYIYIHTIIHTAPKANICLGLEQLVQNANTNLLSKCGVDKTCSQLTCQLATNALLSNELDTLIVTPEYCKNPQGIILEFQKGGAVLFSQLFTKPTQVNQTIGSTVFEVYAFVDTTTVGNAIGFSVRKQDVFGCAVDNDIIPQSSL